MGIPVLPDVDLVLKRLQEGRLDDFIGSIEWAQFECKASPYQLDRLDQKFEFAKDVSGMANAEGGVILIGVATEALEVGQAEVVKEVRKFSDGLVDTKQMQEIIQSLLYPKLLNLVIKWYPDSADRSKGVVAVHVPPVSAELRPILVAKVADSSKTLPGYLFGLFERARDHVVHLDVAQLHAAIRGGRNSQHVLEKLEALQSSVDSIEQKYKQPEPVAGKTENSAILHGLREGTPRLERARVVDSDLIDAGLNQLPTYVLEGTPLSHLSFQEFFSSNNSVGARLVRNPPEIRATGFAIDGGGSVRIHKGVSWRSLYSEEHRVLKLGLSGSVLFAAPADDSFLCRARHQEPGKPRINPVVLVESLLLFAMLLRQVQGSADPKNVGYRLRFRLERAIGLEQISRQRYTLHLGPGPMGSYPSNPRPAPEIRFEQEETWAQGEIDPAALAYVCLTRIYEWFGITHDSIPYVKLEGGKKIVDVSQLQTLRG